MAVYDQGYQPWTGSFTPTKWRFLIIPKYALKKIFAARGFNTFYLLCFAYPVMCLLMVYIRNNMAFLKTITPMRIEMFDIGPLFFYIFVRAQGFLSLIIAFIAGPALISGDMVNNGLALYFSRPFSRTDYILGKLMVLIILLSGITWVPGIFIFAFQCLLSETPYFWQNLRIVAGIFITSWLLILIISLSILAVSAYVRKKYVARWGFLVLIFMVTGIGEAVNQIFRTQYGSLLRINDLIFYISAQLFNVSGYLVPSVPGIPCCFVLAGIIIVSVILLYRRIQPVEVIR